MLTRPSRCKCAGTVIGIMDGTVIIGGIGITGAGTTGIGIIGTIAIGEAAARF